MGLVECIFDIVVEPLRRRVEGDIDKNGVPFDVWRFFFDRQKDTYWEFEANISSAGRVSVPLLVYEAHPLFKEVSLYAVSDPLDRRKVLLLDVEAGIRMATVAGAYIGQDTAHARSYIVTYPRGHGVIIAKPLIEGMGLTTGKKVRVEAFPPDEDMPKGYIVISPTAEETSG